MHPRVFEVFYDGDCPLCRREIELLQRLDRKSQVLSFTNIATEEKLSIEKSHAELMGRIHGRDLKTGEIVEGVEVFRRLYAAVGFSPIVALTRFAPISWLLDRGYEWFAKNRLRLTGRDPVAAHCTDHCSARSS